MTIDNSTFNPSSATVSAGSTVMWTNEQGVSHTVTAEEGTVDSSTIESGGTFSHVFDAPGTSAYHCTIHPSMTARTVERQAGRERQMRWTARRAGHWDTSATIITASADHTQSTARRSDRS